MEVGVSEIMSFLSQKSAQTSRVRFMRHTMGYSGINLLWVTTK